MIDAYYAVVPETCFFIFFFFLNHGHMVEDSSYTFQFGIVTPVTVYISTCCMQSFLFAMFILIVLKKNIYNDAKKHRFKVLHIGLAIGNHTLDTFESFNVDH